MRLRPKIVCVVICLALVCACSPPKPSRFSEAEIGLFDSVSFVVGYGADSGAFKKTAASVFAFLGEYHALYDIYTETDAVASINAINRSAGAAAVRVDARIIGLFKFGRYIYDITGGKTNIALGAVLRVWHERREEGTRDPANARLPSMDELAEAAKHTDINDMIIDEENGTVYLADPLMSLDVGAIAKGYATEQAALWLRQSGRNDILLNIGGNVRATGSRPDGTAWLVGVTDPVKYETNADDPLFLLDIRGLSVVSSGDYERYYTVDGVRYHHIIDPDTLMPAMFYRSVVVVCEDSGLADGLSTGLFCMPYEQSRALADSLPGVEACWVMPDGGTRATDGFAALVNGTQ